MAVLGLLVSCATKPEGPELCGLAGYTGFLNDYSRLEPSPTHPGAWYEQWIGLGDYDAFVIDTIHVLPDKSADCKPIDRETADALGAELRNEVVEALRISGFRIATEPGPRTARLRGAITEITRTKRVPGECGPQTLLGGAACEMEIVDSVTGERLAAAVERDRGGTEFRKGEADPYFGARLVFRHWAARLGMWLRGQRGE